MKKLNKVTGMVLAAALMVTALTGCGKNQEELTDIEAASGQLNVVATIFPEYDFLRQIGGDKLNLIMLLPPGAESHSFEPTPQDIKNVLAADLFVYVGGESDAWVETILDSTDQENMTVMTLLDCVEPVEEELVEGMTEEEHDHDEEEETVDNAGTAEGAELSDEAGTADGSEAGDEEVEYDEHVWTSPVNAALICEKLCDTLCELDPDNKDYYEKNTEEYVNKLNELDGEFREVVANAKRTEIIVGDRFPFRYFADEYGLTYYAAFPGCAADTEPSAATMAFLVDKVKADEIPVVFHIELSNEKICDAICEQTGAKKELLNAVHNVTKDDFEAGVTYLDLMEQNVKTLKEALN